MNHTYQINHSSDNLRSRVFILQKSELEKRLDPMFYAHEYNQYDKKLSKKPFKKFHQILKSINNGYDFRDYKESGTPYLKVANVKQGELDFTKIQYIDFNSSEISKNIQLKKGNLLLTRKGTFGNAFALDKDYDFVISSEVFYIELQDNLINPKFLEIFFNSRIGQAQFDKNKIGAIMGSLSQESIRDLKIPLPSSDIQNQIVSIYESYIAQKQKNEAQAEKLLSSIDDYLLKELGIKLPEPPENTLKNRMFFKNISEISGNKWDVNYYTSYQKHYNDAILKSGINTIKLGKLCQIDWGNTNLTKALYVEDGYPAYSAAGQDGYLPFFEHQEDAIILSAIGARCGKCFLVINSKWTAIKNTITIVPKSKIDIRFLFEILDSERLWDKSGGAQPFITMEAAINRIIPFPSSVKQNEIAEHITSIRQQVQQLKDKTKELLKKASEEIEKILIG